MLEISENRINKDLSPKDFKSFQQLSKQKHGQKTIRVVAMIFGGIFLLTFLPWTQNIRSKGTVTTLRPDQRPQTIHSVIDGRIEEWFVQEGDFVEKGDTILHLSEIKDAYFDTLLVERTQQQIIAKEKTIESYENKIEALANQLKAQERNKRLKIEQAENKLTQALLQVRSDSIDFEAAKLNQEVAQKQYDRIEELNKEGLKSKTDVENRSLKLQAAEVKFISAENKLLSSQNKAQNAQIEVATIEAQYNEYLAKTASSKYTAESDLLTAQAEVVKMNTQLNNYKVRRELYFVKAPQTGYITKALITGLGELVKSGQELISIMPAQHDLAVEMYIAPVDLPLIALGQHVRIQFDGWPAIVFSGWPNTSYGTFGGEIVAIDNFASNNGMYRVLVSPDNGDHPWPEALRVGGGTRSMILLNDVPIWYELWRNINGFPPDFYDNSGKAPSKGGKK